MKRHLCHSSQVLREAGSARELAFRLRAGSDDFGLSSEIISSNSDSFPRLAAVEALQGEQDLARLAPKRGLIAAQPVEGIGRQVGQADKRPREIVEWIWRL